MGMGWPGKRLVGPAALFANTRLLLVEPAFMRQPMAALLTLIHGRHQQKLTEATPNTYTQRRDALGLNSELSFIPRHSVTIPAPTTWVMHLRATQSNA